MGDVARTKSSVIVRVRNEKSQGLQVVWRQQVATKGRGGLHEDFILDISGNDWWMWKKVQSMPQVILGVRVNGETKPR